MKRAFGALIALCLGVAFAQPAWSEDVVALAYGGWRGYDGIAHIVTAAAKGKTWSGAAGAAVAKCEATGKGVAICAIINAHASPGEYISVGFVNNRTAVHASVGSNAENAFFGCQFLAEEGCTEPVTATTE